MSLFIDKHDRRNSPLALAAFGAALLYLCVFGLLYAVLAEPLYEHVRLGSAAASTAAHSVIIALAGTAACCLLFLLEDKRVAPLGFAGLAVILGMFCAAALMLEGEERTLMLRLICMYGAAPVLMGNAAAWTIYWRLRSRHPAPGRRKTIQQELMEAAAKEAAKRERQQARQTGAPQERAAGTPVPAPEPPPEEAPSGPAVRGGPCSSRTEEEEAMLLYMDDGDEESDD